MTKLVQLEKNYEIKLNSQVTPFLNPDVVFLPVSIEITRFQKNQIIKKGEKISETIFSPISGTVEGIKSCLLATGEVKQCLAIANDYQERVLNRIAVRRQMTAITKEDFLASIFKPKLRANFEQKIISEIIISGIDDEVYIANEIFIQKENTKKILEMIDVLSHLYGDCKATIAIKNMDRENIEAYTNFLGTYKNIQLKLVEDLYLIGKEKYLIDSLHASENYLYLHASDVLELYENVKKRKPLLEKYITVTGDGLKNPQVIQTKLGARVKDILACFFEENLKELDIYVNGLMQGKQMDIENLIVTEDLLGLVIMQKKDVSEYECVRCGQCLEICPIGSNPLLAYDKGEQVPCIHCGLCSYICPAYIHLDAYLRGEKK